MGEGKNKSMREKQGYFTYLCLILALLCLSPLVQSCRKGSEPAKKPKSRETVASTDLKNIPGSQWSIHDLIIMMTHPEIKDRNIGKITLIEGTHGHAPHPDTLVIDENLQSVVVFPTGSSLRLENCQFDSPLLDCWIGWKVPANPPPDSGEFSAIWSSEKGEQNLFQISLQTSLA